MFLVVVPSVWQLPTPRVREWLSASVGDAHHGVWRGAPVRDFHATSTLPPPPHLVPSQGSPACASAALGREGVLEELTERWKASKNLSSSNTVPAASLLPVHLTGNYEFPPVSGRERTWLSIAAEGCSLLGNVQCKG